MLFVFFIKLKLKEIVLDFFNFESFSDEFYSFKVGLPLGIQALSIPFCPIWAGRRTHIQPCSQMSVVVWKQVSFCWLSQNGIDFRVIMIIHTHNSYILQGFLARFIAILLRNPQLNIFQPPLSYEEIELEVDSVRGCDKNTTLRLLFLHLVPSNSKRFNVVNDVCSHSAV